jgi:hypothetical protein
VCCVSVLHVCICSHLLIICVVATHLPRTVCVLCESPLTG